MNHSGVGFWYVRGCVYGEQGIHGKSLHPLLNFAVNLNLLKKLSISRLKKHDNSLYLKSTFSRSRSEMEFSVQDVYWEVPLGSPPAEIRRRKQELTEGGMKV